MTDIEKYSRLVNLQLRGALAHALTMRGKMPSDYAMDFLEYDDFKLRELSEFCFEHGLHIDFTMHVKQKIEDAPDEE